MTPERFEQMLREPMRTRSDLEVMQRNALCKGEGALARLAAEVLAERFPSGATQRKGPTPTTAVLLGKSEDFATGKDAYVWLLEQFTRYRNTICEEYEALQLKDVKSAKRVARRPSQLFPPGSNRADNSANYSALSNGWVADTNLNHQDKFSVLIRFAYLVRLEYPTQWEFRVEGSTTQLRDQQEMVIRGNELLREFENLR